MFDVDSVRKHFPALAEGAAHFDSPGGSQVADVVADAVSTTLTSAIANRGRATRAERRADDIVHSARLAAADLLNADPNGVVFGRSMTQLTYDFSRALARTWAAGDEVVVTRLDHDANIRPWVQAAYRAGAVVRWADFDPDTGELTVHDVTRLLSERTRLVAVTGASNLIGTRPRVADVAAAAHRSGALVYVDGVHLTPHAPTDIIELGADFYVCSPYKFFGPHCGVLAGNPTLLETLEPEKLLPSTDVSPERFELGTLPYELLAGTTAAIDFIAGLDRDATGSRRERIVCSLSSVERYEQGLCERLERELASVSQIVLHGRPLHRTPTLLFSVAGCRSEVVQGYLADLGVNAPAGSFYAVEAARWMGLGDTGAVRVGLAPYTDSSDVARLVDGLRRFVHERQVTE
jgi:cysteine desulfurase family protein (TIGR01976 family)